MSLATECICGNIGYFCDGSEGCFYAKKQEEEENAFWKRQVDIIKLQSRITELEAENLQLKRLSFSNEKHIKSLEDTVAKYEEMIDRFIKKEEK